MLARVTYVDYTPRYPDSLGDFVVDDLTVRLTARTEAGDRIVRYVTGMEPHLYVPAEEDVPDDGEEWTILGAEHGFESFDGVDLKRLVPSHPKQAPKIREEVSATYEADIPFYRRATWDFGLSGYIDLPTEKSECRVHIDDVETAIDPEDVTDPITPRVAIGDLEVVSDTAKEFEEMKTAAEDPIIAATWFDSYEEEFLVIVVDDGAVDGGEVKNHLRDHWGDHDLAGEYVDAAITLTRVETEADLLKKTVGFFQRRRPDVVSGWNFSDFDWYYLLERLKAVDGVDHHDLSDIGGVSRYQEDRELSIQKAVDGLPAMDQMAAYCDKMTFGEWRSKRLEYVASTELGVGKIDDVNVTDAYEHERSKLVAYNLLDVQLCVEMSRRYAIEDFFLTLADMCAIQLYDTFSEKREVDGYIGSRRADDEVLPNQTGDDVVKPAGGIVLSPSQGVEDDVAVFDLKSLYPSSMLSCNISPETMADPSDADVVIPGMPEKEEDVGGSITAADINWDDHSEDLPWSQRPKGFRLDEQGIMPKYVARLFRERARYKAERDAHEPGSVEYEVYDRRQQAIKVIMNSFYGVSNSKYYRLARDGIGDAITGVSRYVTWRAAEFIEGRGYEVIYGDTDSVLVSLSSYKEGRSKRELLKDGRGICNALNRHMETVADDLGLPSETFAQQVDHGSDRHAWHFEFEKLYDSFIQCGSKKRYAGLLAWKEGKDVSELDVTGFEAERSDVTERTSEVQAEVIEQVLSGAEFSDVSLYVRQQIEEVREGAGDLHEIGVPYNLGKPLAGPDSYGNLPRARAARFSNEHLGKEYAVGDDFRGYYVRRTPSFTPETDVIALDWTDDIPEDYELNVPKTVEKAFESALRPILAEMGWTFNEVREGKRNQPAADDAVMGYSGDPFADRSAGSSSEENAESDPSDGHSTAESTDDDSGDEFTGAAAW